MRLTCGITVGDDETTILSLELVGSPDGLVEERWEALGEASRTVPSHALGWVLDVGLAIITRRINPVPARREHDFKANAISTIRIHECLVRKEMTEERTFIGTLGVVEAVESKSSGLEEFLRVVGALIPEGLLDIGNRVAEVALIGVTSDHVEACRECRDGGVAFVGEQKVVSEMVSKDLVFSGCRR